MPNDREAGVMFVGGRKYLTLLPTQLAFCESSPDFHAGRLPAMFRAAQRRRVAHDLSVSLIVLRAL